MLFWQDKNQRKFQLQPKRNMILLLKKYSPEHMETGEKYINQAITRIQVIKIDIDLQGVELLSEYNEI